MDGSVGILHNMGSGNWLVLIWRLMATIALGLGQFQRFLSCDLGAGFHKLHLSIKTSNRAFPGGSVVQNLPVKAGEWVQFPVCKDPTSRGATKLVHHNY